MRYENSLKSGIDCSHFVQQIYKRNGMTIPSACNDIIKCGKKVSIDKARPGDVVYYPVNNGYGHVGIYIGDGFIVNSTGHAGKEYPNGGVRICCVTYHDREQYSIYNIIDYTDDL